MHYRATLEIRFSQADKLGSLLADLSGNLLIELCQPALGNLLNAVSGAGQHTCQSPGSIGVIALIDRCNQTGFKTVGGKK